MPRLFSASVRSILPQKLLLPGHPPLLAALDLIIEPVQGRLQIGHMCRQLVPLLRPCGGWPTAVIRFPTL